jgi:hypothetical protein
VVAVVVVAVPFPAALWVVVPIAVAVVAVASLPAGPLVVAAVSSVPPLGGAWPYRSENDDSSENVTDRFHRSRLGWTPDRQG